MPKKKQVNIIFNLYIMVLGLLVFYEINVVNYDICLVYLIVLVCSVIRVSLLLVNENRE